MASTVSTGIGEATEIAIANHRKAWRDVAFCVKPADRRRAELAVHAIYKACEISPPREIIWFDSPIQGAFAATLLKELSTDLYETMRARIYDRAEKRLWAKAQEKSSLKWWRQIYDRVSKNGEDVIYANLAGRLCNLTSRYLLGGFEEIPSLAISEARIEFATRQLQAVYNDLDKRLLPVDWSTIQRTFNLHPTSLTTSIERALQASISQMVWRCGPGSFDAHRLQVLDFCHQSGIPLPMLDGVKELAKSAGVCWMFREYCVLTERPKVISVDREGRLHSGRGTAIAYRDGWSMCSWHGTLVPRRFVRVLKERNADMIITESNVELKRMMIDAYGHERFLYDSRARIVHEDRFGILYRREMMHDEPLCMVGVINSTPEPDGTHKRYYLRVPPQLQTARAAVAWTFGLEPNEYDPQKQT